MDWYYVKEGNRHGPLTFEQIKDLITKGDLKPDDLVWNETMGNSWVKASTVHEFFGENKPSTTNIPRGSTKNSDLMKMARQSLSGLWGISALAWLIFLCVMMAASAIPTVSFFVSVLLSGPMTLGISLFFLAIARKAKPELSMIFEGFKKSFSASLLAYILMNLFIFLWSLLLIIPGIVASLSYSMTFFILADNPEIGALEAIRQSKTIMRGHRFKLFCLYCRFIGWALLSILTLGIGFLWLEPYITTSMALFYEDIKKTS